MIAPLASPPPGFDLAPHRTLGRYELLVPLARGGMAMVWAARLKGSRGFEKLVAVKTMLPGMSDQASFERMFLDEATLAAKVRHPHVVEILDLGEADKILYIVMEWVEGEALNVIMNAAATRGGVPVPIGVRILMQACAGLHAAHELVDENGRPLGLVHRDVSPQNILVTYGGVTKVADFGIAKAMARGGGSTEVGEVKGKVAYMSPEQALGAPVDRRSDVFGLGILFHLLATGTHPFRGETDAETFAKIAMGEEAVFPRELAPDFPPSLEQVLMRALARDPDQRYESANALLRALDKALPPSMRGSVADEEVGAFVRSLLGDERERRSAQLAAALREAEKRAEVSQIRSIDNGSSLARSFTDSYDGTAMASDAGPRPRKTLIVAVGALILLIAGVAGFFLTRGQVSAGTDNAAAAEPARVEPRPAPPPPSAAAPAPPPAETTPAATAPPVAETAAVPPPRTKRAPAEKRKNATPPSPAPAPAAQAGARSDVSPVRSPGF